ncbi:UDP-glucose 4-epimerase-like [Liolophura sinensis]|uniref:UDP-glucose 4-epimerase-like n=1 Tax=Liolophura sinensis TaxID=3198878 RepID=UPI0031597143
MSSDAPTVLVTGGAGFVGSHAVVELINAGYKVVIIDNFYNANIESVQRMESICGTTIPYHTVDICDIVALNKIFDEYKFHSVMHFAGLKAVGESVKLPLLYYKTNVGGTLNLLQAMREHGVYNLVFSSSTTVYGPPQRLPIDEYHPRGTCTNPYGKTKYFIEEILIDTCKAESHWNIILLRYFNPVGAHSSGLIGEDPKGVPHNLMPFIAQVAVGRHKELKVFGNDYDTPDGTAVRDYIHVVDLALGHVAAIKKIEEKCGCQAYNLGTGVGYSVLDVLKAFEKAAGKPVPYTFVNRRAGDVPACYGDPSKAEKELGWKATRTLDQMCEDTWRWQSSNPYGFQVVNGK